MAVDIETFKSDLEQLKNQRSVIQAKLDEANRHVAELTETLKGMGYSSVDEAKQAYLKQLSEAENLHALVKQLIQEINQVDANVPTREDVIQRLSVLENNIIPDVPKVVMPQQVNVEASSVSEAPVPSENDFIQQNIVQPGVVTNPVDTTSNNDGTAGTTGDIDLGGMLFASL